MPRTIELIDLTLVLVNFAAQRFKHALAVARPNQIDARIFPAILTPAHGSLPSGHAAEAFAVSNVLLSLLDKENNPKNNPKNNPNSREDARNTRSETSLGRRLLGLAARIANNREVAGVHYPVDTLAGRLLGTVLAEYLVARCTGTTSCGIGRFDGASLNKKVPESDLPKQDSAKKVDDVCALGEVDIPVPRSEALRWLWDCARQEWGRPPVAPESLRPQGVQ